MFFPNEDSPPKIFHAKILPYESSPPEEMFLFAFYVIEVDVVRISKEFRSSLVSEVVLRPGLENNMIFLKISKYHEIFYCF
jgi:hypothetical protein